MFLVYRICAYTFRYCMICFHLVYLKVWTWPASTNHITCVAQDGLQSIASYFRVPLAYESELFGLKNAGAFFQPGFVSDRERSSRRMRFVIFSQDAFWVSAPPKKNTHTLVTPVCVCVCVYQVSMNSTVSISFGNLRDQLQAVGPHSQLPSVVLVVQAALRITLAPSWRVLYHRPFFMKILGQLNLPIWW